MAMNTAESLFQGTTTDAPRPPLPREDNSRSQQDVRSVLDHRGDRASKWAVITAVSEQLGMNAETGTGSVPIDDGRSVTGSAMRPPTSPGTEEAHP